MKDNVGGSKGGTTLEVPNLRRQNNLKYQIKTPYPFVAKKGGHIYRLDDC